MDFRAMLMKRKKPAKKVVVVRIFSFLSIWLFDTFLVQIQILINFFEVESCTGIIYRVQDNCFQRSYYYKAIIRMLRQFG